MPTLLVFGARNLGRVLSRELAADGWRVAAVARTEDTIQNLRDEVPDAVGLIGDAGDAADVAEAPSGIEPLCEALQASA